MWGQKYKQYLAKCQDVEGKEFGILVSALTLDAALKKINTELASIDAGDILLNLTEEGYEHF